MELKDVVLQTISEIEDSVDEKGFKHMGSTVNEGEMEFLQAFKERIFVVFEGIRQESNTKSHNEDMRDIVLGFLQFQLALIDSRIEALDKRVKGK